MTPESIKKMRQSSGMTQTQAGALIGVTWRQWCRYESGASAMSPILWQVWRIRAGFDAPNKILNTD